MPYMLKIPEHQRELSGRKSLIKIRKGCFRVKDIDEVGRIC